MYFQRWMNKRIWLNDLINDKPISMRRMKIKFILIYKYIFYKHKENGTYANKRHI